MTLSILLKAVLYTLKKECPSWKWGVGGKRWWVEGSTGAPRGNVGRLVGGYAGAGSCVYVWFSVDACVCECVVCVSVCVAPPVASLKARCRVPITGPLVPQGRLLAQRTPP